MRRIRLSLPSLLLLAFVLAAAAQEPPQMARLGECQLESGEVLRDCRVAYRTAGKLNADKSNAILFPTWFTGRSTTLVANAKPGAMLDPEKYFVVFVDALGNGVSSSPSNSPAQMAEKFPRITIRDMVNSQYRLVTETLGLKRLHAVIGMSMGGMQAFEWAVAYPGFAEKVVSIAGTPQQTSYDLLLWRTQEEAIIEHLRCSGGDPAHALRIAGLVSDLAIATPSYRTARTTPADFATFFETTQKQLAERMNAYDYLAQLRAMIAHDIAARFSGSLEQAAMAIRAQVLVVVATQDHMVNPEPSVQLARRLGPGAAVIELTNDCGHLAFSCEAARATREIAQFLERPQPLKSESQRGQAPSAGLERPF